MKTIRVAALFAVGFAAAALAPTTPAAAETVRHRINIGTDVPLQCAPGAPGAKGGWNTNVTNTTGATIPKGVRIDWVTSNQDPIHNHFVLAADLPPGGQAPSPGGSGPGYTCTAKMSSMADLVPWKAEWQANNSSVKVEVKDLDPWVAAEPSVARVEVMSCGGQVLQTYDSVPFTVAKGSIASVTIPATFVPGKTYLRLTVDATSKVLERSETNNVMDASGSCIH